MTALLQHKYNGTLKDMDVQRRTIEFHASVFNNEDSDKDILRPGSYLKTIQENGPLGKNRIMHLRQHDSYQVITKPSEISEDAYGLFCRSVFPDTELANDTLKLHEAGILTEFSVGIQVVKAMYPNGEGWGNVREILECKLYEVSSVTWGANEQAKLIGTKSEQKIKALDYMERLIKGLRDGRFRDNVFETLEYELLKVKQYIHSLEVNEPEQSTHKAGEPLDVADILLTFKNSLTK